MVDPTMDMLSWLRNQIQVAEPAFLREMVHSFAEALMGAEADALCGAGYGERSLERTNRRNGYRERRWDTASAGSPWPYRSFDWLLEHRRRAERALVAVVADCYLAGVSTRRVDKL